MVPYTFCHHDLGVTKGMFSINLIKTLAGAIGRERKDELRLRPYLHPEVSLFLSLMTYS